MKKYSIFKVERYLKKKEISYILSYLNSNYKRVYWTIYRQFYAFQVWKIREDCLKSYFFFQKINL